MYYILLSSINGVDLEGSLFSQSCIKCNDKELKALSYKIHYFVRCAESVDISSLKSCLYKEMNDLTRTACYWKLFNEEGKLLVEFSSENEANLMFYVDDIQSEFTSFLSGC